MDLISESARLDKVMEDVYMSWCAQLNDLDASIRELSDMLASTEKTDLSENATYTILRDERDVKVSSKIILVDKVNAYTSERDTYQPTGVIKLGSTILLDVVSVDGVPSHRSFPPFKLVIDDLSSGVQGLLSIESKVGSSCVGLHANDTFEVQVPTGTVIYRVKEVY